MKNDINCIIPIRSGSKEIVNKNIIDFNGEPLICNTIRIVLKCKFIKNIIIATDSLKYVNIIKKFFNNKRIIFFLRSKKSASNKAKTEIVLNEVLRKYDKIKNVLFLQCTSPLICREDLINARKLFQKGYDSFFSGYLTHQFLWKKMKFNYTPINYDPIHRPMRQDHKPLIIENGAVYGFKAKDFLKYNSRLFKKIGFIEMNRYRSIEIDSKLDFKVSKLLNRFM
tara:strand:+ start:693 stop:1367 length:675 start_codon:yes stop_codon:yes gene_type:complete